MKKTVKTICVVLLSALVMSSITACAERTIVVAHQDNSPDVSVKENITINWDQVISDCEDTLNESDYPLTSYLDYVVDEDNKTITLSYALLDNATQIESLDYGVAYIKAFNDAVATQDFKYAFSSDDYYGGLWDVYNLDLEVYRDSDVMWSENYFVYQSMDAGSDDPVIPQIKATSSKEEDSSVDETSAESTEIKNN